MSSSTQRQRPNPAERPSRPPVLRRLGNRERRYPVWSARALLLAGFIGLALTGLAVAVLGHGRVIARIEVTLAIVAAALFLTLAVGLYSGARVRKREDVVGELRTVGASALPDSFPDVGSGLDLGGGDGCLGAILGLVALVIVAIVAALLVLLAINAGLVLYFVLAAVTGGVFHRAIRQVFARSRRCRGDLAASLLYAGWYTVLYTGWLFAALTAVSWAMKRG